MQVLRLHKFLKDGRGAEGGVESHVFVQAVVGRGAEMQTAALGCRCNGVDVVNIGDIPDLCAGRSLQAETNGIADGLRMAEKTDTRR